MHGHSRRFLTAIDGITRRLDHLEEEYLFMNEAICHHDEILGNIKLAHS